MAAQKRARPAAQAPVSAHPLFPVIVALWFAALLGIGTMVLPQALFDQVGVATGLGAIGFTFRLGLGLAAGLVGALIGILLARKVASGQGPAQPRKPTKVADHADSNARKPISAMEELGSEGLDEPIEDSDDGFRSPVGGEPLAGRRRPLTVTDESAPSERLTHVPLPGSEDVLDLIGAEDFPRDYSDDDALELGHFDQEEHDIVPDYPHPPEPARPGSPLFGSDPFTEADPVEVPPPSLAPAPSAMEGVFRAPQPAVDVPAPFQQGAPFTPPSPAPATAQQFGAPAATEQAAHPLFVPQPQVAPVPAAMATPYAASTQPAPSPAGFGTPAFSMPEPVEAAPTEAASFAFAEATTVAEVPPPQQMFAQPELARANPADELAGLATVALVERFARALRMAGGTAPVSVPAAAVQAPAFAMPQPAAPAPAPFASEPETPFPAAPAAPFGASAMPAVAMAPAHPDPAPAAHAAPFGGPSLPAALAPMSFDEPEEGDDHLDSFSLPIGDMAKPFASPDAPAVPQTFAQPFAVPQPGAEADSDGEPENEDNFGSLLAMKSPFGAPREFVRIEDDDDDDGMVEPVVVFPGTAPQGGAMPASDGPSRDPAQSAPFTRPQFAPQPAAQPAAQPVDRHATEAALRDALARLQQMSGAA